MCLPEIVSFSHLHQLSFGKEKKPSLGCNVIWDRSLRSSVHICVTLLHTKDGVIDSFVNDVRTMTAEIMKDPNAQTGGAVSTSIRTSIHYANNYIKLDRDRDVFHTLFTYMSNLKKLYGLRLLKRYLHIFH